MARDGNGTYTLASPGNPVVTGTTISSTVQNNTMNDLASSMTNSTAKDGQTVITGAWDFNGNKIILDVDADTSITANTDDIIDFEVNSVDAVKFGWQSVTDTGFLTVDPAAFTADATENTHRVAILNSQAITIPTGTTPLVSGLYITEPNITATGTVTVASTVYIKGAPTEGATNYAVWIDAGNVKLDGALTIDGLTTFASLVGATGATITGILDEDSMSSDSATHAATQQSIKAYVDASGGGDVAGPASATDNAVARYNLTTGKIIQDSSVLIDDSNNVTGVVGLTASGAITGATIDGAIGSVTPAAGTFNSLALTGALAGADNTVSRVNLLDYGETTNAIGSTGGGTQDIDIELGNSVSATVDTSANTFTFSNPTASDELSGFTLVLTNGGSQTVTWPASVDWPGGTAPTLTASGVDILVFFTIDGGTIWHGMIASTASA